MKRLLLLLLALLAVPAQAETRWTLIHTYPHDDHAFTEGLLFHDGLLYESTGQVGQSGIRVVDVTSGRVLRRVTVPPPYFGEGIALWKDWLLSLTWRHGQGFVWNRANFKKIGGFRYKGEGWGMTSDGSHLIMSDGTPDLRFLDPVTLKETARISVTDRDGGPLSDINELEYVDGEILANIWMTTRIARIDAKTGHVIDWIDIAPLAIAAGVDGMDDVANGIAWDAKGRRLFVTGKNWPKLFEIRLEK